MLYCRWGISTEAASYSIRRTLSSILCMFGIRYTRNVITYVRNFRSRANSLHPSRGIYVQDGRWNVTKVPFYASYISGRILRLQSMKKVAVDSVKVLFTSNNNVNLRKTTGYCGNSKGIFANIADKYGHT